MTRRFDVTKVREHVLASIDAAELAQVEAGTLTDRIFVGWSKADGSFLGELIIDYDEWLVVEGWDGGDGTEALCSIITALTTKLRKPSFKRVDRLAGVRFNESWCNSIAARVAGPLVEAADDSESFRTAHYNILMPADAVQLAAAEHEARKLREAGERHDRDKMRHELMQYAHEVQPDCVSRVGWERVVIACVEYAERVDHDSTRSKLAMKRIDEAAQALRLYLETP